MGLLAYPRCWSFRLEWRAYRSRTVSCSLSFALRTQVLKNVTLYSVEVFVSDGLTGYVVQFVLIYRDTRANLVHWIFLVAKVV